MFGGILARQARVLSDAQLRAKLDSTSRFGPNATSP